MVSLKIKQEIAWFRDELKREANPQRAQGEKKYLKSPLKHYGLTVPALRKLAKTWLHQHPDATIDQVIKLSQQLWVGEYHEERMLAIFLLVFRQDDLSWEHFPVVENMVRTALGWAQLDMIAAWLCGHMFTINESAMTKHLHIWIKDDNFWVQRAALLTLLGPVRHDSRHFQLFQELATPLLPEKEFFLRKAIGWVLRELSKVEPDIVYQYVLLHGSQMAGLTYREATRKLPPSLQNKLK